MPCSTALNSPLLNCSFPALKLSKIDQFCCCLLSGPQCDQEADVLLFLFNRFTHELHSPSHLATLSYARFAYGRGRNRGLLLTPLKSSTPINSLHRVNFIEASVPSVQYQLATYFITITNHHSSKVGFEHLAPVFIDLAVNTNHRWFIL